MPSGSASPDLDLVHLAADDLDLAVADLVELDRGHVLEGRGPVAAELHPHVGLADALALEGGAVGNRHRDLRDSHLAAAHLERLLDHALVGHRRHHVLVGADPGGQDLGDVGVGDDRKAVVDGACRHGVLLGVHLAEGEDEGEDPVPVVPEVGPEVAGRDAAEGQRHPVGESERVDQRRHVLAEGHQPGLPAQLHPFLGELFGELPAAGRSRHEDVDVLLLELARDPDRDLVRRRGPGDGGKARRGAVHELDAALADDHVGGGAEPDAAGRRPRR